MKVIIKMEKHRDTVNIIGLTDHNTKARLLQGFGRELVCGLKVPKTGMKV